MQCVWAITFVKNSSVPYILVNLFFGYIYMYHTVVITKYTCNVRRRIVNLSKSFFKFFKSGIIKEIYSIRIRIL